MLRKLIYWLILIIIVVFVVKAVLNHFEKKDTPITSQLISTPTLADNINIAPAQVQQATGPVDEKILKDNEAKLLSTTTANESAS